MQTVVNMFSYKQDNIDESVNRFYNGTSGPLRGMLGANNNIENLKGIFRSTNATLISSSRRQGSSPNGATEANAVRVKAARRAAVRPLPTTSPIIATTASAGPVPDEEEIAADLGGCRDQLGGDGHVRSL